MLSRAAHVLQRLRQGDLPPQLRATSLYRVPLLRYGVARLRHAFLVRTRGLETLSKHGSSHHTVDHNQRSLVGFNTRNEQLLFGTLLLEDIANARVLIIGCRSEEEILMFRGYGFEHLTAIDLISYSPWIGLSDMHQLPYADASFDIVFCSYTLSYSDDPGLAAREITRVLCHDGVVAIAVEYMPHALRGETQDALLGYRIGQQPLDSTRVIRNLFEPHVGKVFVDYDAEKKRHHTKSGLVRSPSPLITVFRICKDGSQ